MTTEPPLPPESGSTDPAELPPPVPDPTHIPPPSPPASPEAMTGWATLGNGRVVELGSPGARIGARLLDGLILGVGGAILAFLGIGGGALVASTGTEEAAALAVSAIFGLLAVLAVLGLAYEVALIALRGQTVGKMATGVRVVRADTGDLPGWGKSIGRWAIPYLAGLLPVVGWLLSVLTYVSLTWDDRRQGWHDKAAGTVVVKA